MEEKTVGCRKAEHDSPMSPKRFMETQYPSNAEYVFFSRPNGRCIAGHKACECSVNVVCVCVCVCAHTCLVVQSCLTLCDPMDCIARQAPPGLPFPLPGGIHNPGINAVVNSKKHFELI